MTTLSWMVPSHSEKASPVKKRNAAETLTTNETYALFGHSLVVLAIFFHEPRQNSNTIFFGAIRLSNSPRITY